jgi:hypothetical protein
LSATDEGGDGPSGADEHADGIEVNEMEREERYEKELVVHLDRSQFVAETSRPVTRARLSHRVIVGLWVLRVVVCLLSAMVIYAFVAELH